MGQRIVIISPDEFHKKDIMTTLLPVISGIELFIPVMVSDAINYVREGDITIISAVGTEPEDIINRIGAVSEKIHLILLNEPLAEFKTKFAFHLVTKLDALPHLIKKLTDKQQK